MFIKTLILATVLGISTIALADSSSSPTGNREGNGGKKPDANNELEVDLESKDCSHGDIENELECLENAPGPVVYEN